ncbi:4'-phosphopantetheinyl transferase family protein [Streptomyces tsukubensis]|nr:4'-phosphopantetheinyl transferase superfamily protein [Streptomyces tsukubensis]
MTAVPAPPSSVLVLLLDLEGVEEALLDTSVLEAEERERAAAFIRAEDRVRYTAAHIALRRALARRLDTDTFLLGRAPCPGCGKAHGRPVVVSPDPSVHFSLSHAGRLVLIAIADAPVGVDAEAAPAARTVKELTPSLHPLERSDIEGAPEQERPMEFARVWTRKEAYLKGIGTGLSRGLDRDYVGAARPREHPAGWSLADTSVPAGYAAAVALLTPEPGGEPLLETGNIPKEMVYVPGR